MSSKTNPRDSPMASISSKKITDGADWRAFANSCRMFLSDSPKYLLINSGPWKKQQKPWIPFSFC